MRIESFDKINNANIFMKDKLVKEIKVLREKKYYGNGTIASEKTVFYVIYED